MSVLKRAAVLVLVSVVLWGAVGYLAAQLYRLCFA